MYLEHDIDYWDEKIGHLLKQIQLKAFCKDVQIKT